MYLQNISAYTQLMKNQIKSVPNVETPKSMYT